MMMILQNFRPLVKKSKKNDKLNRKQLKWMFGLVLLALILLIAIYILYTQISNSTATVPKETKKVTIIKNITTI